MAYDGDETKIIFSKLELIIKIIFIFCSIK